MKAKKVFIILNIRRTLIHQYPRDTVSKNVQVQAAIK